MSNCGMIWRPRICPLVGPEQAPEALRHSGAGRNPSLIRYGASEPLKELLQTQVECMSDLFKRPDTDFLTFPLSVASHCTISVGSSVLRTLRASVPRLNGFCRKATPASLMHVAEPNHQYNQT
jgi:hypothetical protein